jgi:hypothetical protein
MILVVQKYTPADAARRQEIESCLEENKSSPLFSHILLLDGDKERWTFGAMFDVCHERFPGEVCVVANSDIVFDDSCRQAEEMLEQCKLLALTRWENEHSPRMIGHIQQDRFFSGSQDSWFFRAGSIPKIQIEIPMGHVGCDNVLVGWAVQNMVRVANPAISLRTYHVHADESRPERPGVSGYYGYPELTTQSLSNVVLCHQVDPYTFFHLAKFSQ